MEQDSELTVGLLSHYFTDDNLGCVALSISNLQLLDEAAKRAGVRIRYRILVNEKYVPTELSFTSNPYSYRVFPSSRKCIRNPLSLLRCGVLDDCDLAININAGDGFTDLYGFGRVLSESYMSSFAQHLGIPVIMAPQTVGPFSGRLSKQIGARVLTRSQSVFVRDNDSYLLVKSLAPKVKVHEMIDVAFALPFQRPVPISGPGKRIGVNVSGLLYRGGYDGKNYFGLAFDYKEFCERLIDQLLANGERVVLVPHVLSSNSAIEDDYSASIELLKGRKELELAPRFPGPMEAKSFISGLDAFSGARMHSTIASFSSGVPVVPIGYSKKVSGLFGSLGYKYFLDARDRHWSAVGAANQVAEWLQDSEALRQDVARGRAEAASKLNAYVGEMAALLKGAVSAKQVGVGL